MEIFTNKKQSLVGLIAVGYEMKELRRRTTVTTRIIWIINDPYRGVTDKIQFTLWIWCYHCPSDETIQFLTLASDKRPLFNMIYSLSCTFPRTICSIIGLSRGVIHSSGSISLRGSGKSKRPLSDVYATDVVPPIEAVTRLVQTTWAFCSVACGFEYHPTHWQSAASKIKAAGITNLILRVHVWVGNQHNRTSELYSLTIILVLTDYPGSDSACVCKHFSVCLNKQTAGRWKCCGQPRHQSWTTPITLSNMFGSADQ
ncbi:hypothetical protein J6590_017489 [Homalodisca vitripennis]|nr:hypothetical protein J6590_017489 [Homalodisca vitripennis]